jgi:hypothetical protein
VPESTRPGAAARDEDKELGIRPAPAFDAAPGEREADAARDAFLQATGRTPTGVAAALTRMDGAAGARTLLRLQEVHGNAYVQRVVAAARATRAAQRAQADQPDERGRVDATPGTPGRLVGQPQAAMLAEVERRKGPGDALPDQARQPLEAHFGADLSGVRVHTDGEAAALTQELEAQAFTVGSDVFVAPDAYDPTSTSGQGLLAHEVAHVGQQGGLGSQGVQRAPAAAQDGPLPMAAPAPAAQAQLSLQRSAMTADQLEEALGRHAEEADQQGAAANPAAASSTDIALPPPPAAPPASPAPPPPSTPLPAAPPAKRPTQLRALQPP